MKTSDFIFVSGAFLLLSFFLFLYRLLANRLNLVITIKRKNLNHKTIVGAGLLFPLTVLVIYLVFGSPTQIFILSLLFVSIIGFMDDVKPIPPILRFVVQILVSYLVLFFHEEHFLSTIQLIILFFFMLSYINASNFMDGINGMLGLQSLISLLCFAFLNYSFTVFQPELIYGLLIACLIFLFGNLRRKPLFISGDVGSLSMGLIIGYFIIIYFVETNNPMLFLLAVIYGLDTCITFISNLSIGVPVFKPHRNHLYEKQVFGLNVPDVKVSVVYGLIQCIVVLVVTLCCISDIGSWGLLMTSTLILFVIYAIFRAYTLKYEFRKTRTD